MECRTYEFRANLSPRQKAKLFDGVPIVSPKKLDRGQVGKGVRLEIDFGALTERQRKSLFKNGSFLP